MPLHKMPPRRLKVGTTGWSADDLDDPRIERLWEAGNYEIVEGVLTAMPPAYFDSSLPLTRLQKVLLAHGEANGVKGDFAFEVDFIVNRRRIAKPDMIFVTPDDMRRQVEARARKVTRGPKVRFGRWLVPPTLVVESLSLGHEDHDQDTKRQWYACAKVMNYWLINAYRRSLECLVLKGTKYRVDATGHGNDKIRPSLYPGMEISLSKLWDEQQ